MQRRLPALSAAGLLWLVAACQPDSNGLAQPSLDLSPPTPPSDITAEALGPHAIQVSWNASSDDRGVAFYEIVRGGQHVVNLGAGGGGGVTRMTFPDANLAAATSYVYVVVAIDRGGNRTPSGPALGTTTGDKPVKL